MAKIEYDSLEEVYQIFLRERSDIHEHLPVLRKYAEQCNHVTEFGVRWGRSTVGLLSGKPKKMVSYDIRNFGLPSQKIKDKVRLSGTDFHFIIADVLKVEIEPTDLLFIDTLHTKAQLEEELRLHASKVRKWIILHDTTTYGIKGEDGKAGLIYAISEFLSYNKNWEIALNLSNNNGLMVLERSKT